MEQIRERYVADLCRLLMRLTEHCRAWLKSAQSAEDNERLGRELEKFDTEFSLFIKVWRDEK